MPNATPKAATTAKPPLAAAELKCVAKRLVENYGKEVELYRSVLKLTELQRANLQSSGDVRDFIALLHQKEDLIRAIDKVELQLDEDKAHWLEADEQQKNGTNADLNALLDEIILTIEKTMKVEQDNEHLLKDRKGQIEQELEAIRKGRNAAREYDPEKDAKLISAIS